MPVKSCVDYTPDVLTISKVKTCGNVVEVTAVQHHTECPCKKISKTEYYDISTGEVFKYNLGANKACSGESVRKALAHVRDILNTNLVDGKCCKFITLTYKENMTDTKCLLRDLQTFWQRMVYHFKKYKIDIPEYITIVEPQGRGAWHAHCFWIWGHSAPFIANCLVARKWGHGFTKTVALPNTDNIGAYFSAYLGDMSVSECKSAGISYSSSAVVKKTVVKGGQKVSKKIVKGARLRFYPSDMHIMRVSRGIKRPTVEKMMYCKAKRRLGSAKLTYRKTFEIFDDFGKSVNKICKEYYNLKCKVKNPVSAVAVALLELCDKLSIPTAIVSDLVFKKSLRW